MNPMLTRFPESVRIDGVRYPLNTDFRVGLRIMSAYEDPQLTRFERQVVLCRLLYQEQPVGFYPGGPGGSSLPGWRGTAQGDRRQAALQL